MNDMTKLPHASSSGFSLGNAVTPSTSNAAASPRPSSNGLPRLWPNMTEDEIKAASAALKEATSRGRPSASIAKWRTVIEGMLAQNTVKAIYEDLKENDDQIAVEFKTYKQFNAKLVRDLGLA